jgi:hypothetical protein
MKFLCAVNWELVIAFFALIVSVTSVLFTYWQTKLQREHNFKTVKPLGRIRTGDYENKIYIRVDNNGAGPLIIKEIITKNKSIETKSAVIDILPNDLTKRITWTNFTGAYEGRAILPGEPLELIVWSINQSYESLPLERVKQDRDELRKALSNVKIRLVYTDIYEKNEFIFESDFSDWYGRHKEE